MRGLDKLHHTESILIIKLYLYTLFAYVCMQKKICSAFRNSSSSSDHQQQNTEIVLVEELNSKLKKSFKKIATLKRSRLESSKQFVSTVLEKEKLSVCLWNNIYLHNMVSAKFCLFVDSVILTLKLYGRQCFFYVSLLYLFL